jgi:hypothetical protein
MRIEAAFALMPLAKREATLNVLGPHLQSMVRQGLLPLEAIAAWD